MKLKLATLALVLALGSASASVLNTLAVTSNGGVDATITSLTFLPDPGATGTIPPGFVPNADVVNTTNLTFTGGPLAVSEGVEINQNAPFVAGPGGTVIPEDFFFRFAQHPNLDFQLSGVFAGNANSNCSTAVNNGDACSLNILGSQSPVVLQNNGAGGSNVSIGFFGIASDTGTAGLATGQKWVGGFSDTVQGKTPHDIALLLCPDYDAHNACTATDLANLQTLHILTNGGSFTVSAASVPEPGTISLFGIGAALIGLSWIRRTNRRKA